MAEWRFDSFKRWDPGSSPTFSDQGPPEILAHLAREIWDEPALRNTEPVLLLIAGDTVGLMDVQFVVGVDATFRRDPVVRVRWRTEADPHLLADAFGEAVLAWLERDAVQGGLVENATAEWAARGRDEHLAAALDLLRRLEGPPQLLPLPTGSEREHMAAALIARTALCLAQDTLQPALVWPSRGRGEWMDQGFHVLDAASTTGLGGDAETQALAASLVGDLDVLATGAAANGGGSLFVGLQRQVVYEQVLQAAFPSLDVVDPPAGLDLLRALDESERDRLLDRVAPALRARIATLGTPCVADGRFLRGPGGTLRFRSPDLAGFQELEGLNLSPAVVLAFSDLLPPSEAVQILPPDLSLWPVPTLAWFASRRTAEFLLRWRKLAHTAEGVAIAQELIQLVPEPDELPVDLLWRADPEGVAARHGAALAAYCEALDPADLPLVLPGAIDSDWWLDQAAHVIDVLPEGVALLLPLIDDAATPLSQDTSRVLWEAATPHQRSALHPLMAGHALLPGVVQRTLLTWLRTGVGAWLEQLPEPDTESLWWVLGAELERDPEAPLLERDPAALFWRYVAYRMHLGGRYTPLPVGQRLVGRLPDEWWQVLATWPAERHLAPLLFDLWVHGPEGLLTDVRPPPGIEDLAAHLVQIGAVARHQNSAVWDGLSASADAWQGALEWARLFERDAAEALGRLRADPELQALARRHGWDQLDVLDPRHGWADRVWAEVRELEAADPVRSALLDSLPDALQLHVVRASGGRVSPGWLGRTP